MVLVLINLYIGLFVFRPALSAGFGGAFRIQESLIALHIAVGLLILALLVVRFVVRLSTKKPAPADAGSPVFNALARVVHYGLDVVLFALTVVGLIFALQTNRLQRALFGGGQRQFGGQGGNFGNFAPPGPGTPFPSFGNQGNNAQGSGNQPGRNPNFQGNGFRGGGTRGRLGFALLPIHMDLAILLSVLLLIHLAAALYHQFILKDHLIARMGYGKG